MSDCKCDPDTWGHRIGQICDTYEPILLSEDRMISVCDICHHDERCHEVNNGR